MKTKEIKITSFISKVIEEEMKQQLTRIGVQVKDVTFLGDNTSFVTSPFVMTPQMFKEIKVKGDIYVKFIKEFDTYDSFEITVSLNYDYKHWRGGSNGCELGTMKFSYFSGSINICRFLSFNLC